MRLFEVPEADLVEINLIPRLRGIILASFLITEVLILVLSVLSFRAVSIECVCTVLLSIEKEGLLLILGVLNLILRGILLVGKRFELLVLG